MMGYEKGLDTMTVAEAGSSKIWGGIIALGLCDRQTRLRRARIGTVMDHSRSDDLGYYRAPPKISSTIACPLSPLVITASEGESSVAYTCTVKISKFDEHNPKAAGRRVAWFRLSADLCHRSDYHSLGSSGKLLWILLLARACSVVSREVYLSSTIDLPQIHSKTPMVLQRAVHRLSELGWIQILSENCGKASKPLRTNERTNVRTYDLDTGVPVSPPSVSRPPAEPKTYRITSLAEMDQRLMDFIPRWKELYPDKDFLVRESRRALVWLEANPKKATKTRRGWAQFFGGWFERSWDRHTTKGPSTQPGQTGDGWREKALQVTTAMRRWPAWDKAELDVRQFLGDDLWRLALKAGTYEMRRMPSNEFYIQNVVKRLKDAKEQIDAEMR